VTVLTGEGLVLRPLTPADAVAHHAGEDDAQIEAFEFPGPAPIGNVVAAIERWQTSWATGGPVRNFGVFRATDDRLCGNVEVEILGDRTVNLSYVVFPEFRRRGVATAAARLALGYAATDLGASRVRITVAEGNLASIGGARALGLRTSTSERSETGRTRLVFEGRIE
jgi:RimJ/RimL family protein N-acetyltransferase